MLKIEELRELIQLIDESNIDEFLYETEGSRVSLKKVDQRATKEKSLDNVVPIVKNSKEEAIAAKVEGETKVKTETLSHESSIDYDHEIVSPMVGTLYSAPSPESDPYVTVGSKITTDSIVCIVEAMKLFNEIEAEVNGEIVEVLVENGELVEYGQPLFRVKTI